MWRCKSLALCAVLELGLLVAVQSCGHHIVHHEIQELAARHLAQQAYMSSSSWGLRTASHRAKVSGDTYDGGVRSRAAASQEQEQTAEGAHPHDHEEPEDLHADEDAGSKQEVETEGAAPDPHGRSLQELAAAAVLAPAPIRLSVTYQQLGSLSGSQQQMLTRVVEAVRRILQKFINVKQPSKGGMLVDPYCNMNTMECYPDFNSRSQNPIRECGLAVIFREHVVNPFNCTTATTRAQRDALGSDTSGPASGAGGGASGYGSGCSSFAGTKGEETDMYLYITAVQNEDCNAGAAAWAKPCVMDLGNNRPLLGAANVCPKALGLLDEGELTAVLTHEMIHALGFTESMYNLTRRPDGSPRPASELVQLATVGGKQVRLLVSPNVRDAARAQFGCPTLAGAQLEEEGMAGSAGSHWEYTHYQGEVMVASTVFAADGTPATLSNLTLSYLDDTGWYVTNRAAAGLLAWGSGAGCELPTLNCSTYMAAVPGQRLFCDAAAAAAQSARNGGAASFMCSNDYKAPGACRALNFTGGCGLILSRNVTQTCLGSDAANDLPDVFGWGTGSASTRCLPVLYRFRVSVGYNRYAFPSEGRDGDADAACFNTACSADGSKVFVKLLGQQFECPEGQYLNLAQLLPSRYLAGRIGPCPPARALCATQSCPATGCNIIGGSCLNGVCYCNLAFTGLGCGFNLITGQVVTDSGSIGPGSSGGGGSGGSSSSPPPPLKTYTDVVQLTLSLNNTVNDVNLRRSQLASAIAEWAGLSSSAVVLTNVGEATSGGAIGSGNGTVAGDNFDATATSSRRRSLLRRRLQQTASAVATAWLTPTDFRPASELLGWLQSNGTQLSLLVSRLASAAFWVVPDGIRYEYIITQSMNPTTPQPSTNPSAPADSRSSQSRTVISVAVAMGAVAVAGIMATIITVIVLRSRRERSHRFARASAYQPPEMPPTYGSGSVTFDSGFAVGGGGGGGFSDAGGVGFIGGGGNGGGGGGFGGPLGVSAHRFAEHGGSGALPNAQYGSTPESAALSYYSALGASMASSLPRPPPPQQQQQQHANGHQPGGPEPLSPLYSGPQQFT